MKSSFFAFTFLWVVLLTSCVNYDAEPFTGHHLPRVSGYSTGVTNDWIYYNLRTGQRFNVSRPSEDIAEGQQHDRLDWDIAFCGYRLRTNGGTSGIGQAAAADLGENNYEKWNSVAQLPANLQWVVDDHSVSITYSRRDWDHYLIENKMSVEENPWFDPNKGPATTTTNANPLLAKALTFTGPPPVYKPSFHTYVIRTADGKRFFKLQIVSWYRGDGKVGDSGGELSFYLDELNP